MDAEYFTSLFADIKLKTIEATNDTTMLLDKAKTNMQNKMGPYLKDVKMTITMGDLDSAEEEVEEFLEDTDETKKQDKLKELHGVITAWCSKMIQNLRKQVELNRGAISEFFGVINEVTDKVVELEAIIDTVKAENEKLVKEKEELASRVDEVQQRSLKGQLVVSTPTRQQGRVLPIPRKTTNEHGQAVVESDLAYTSRLVSLLTKIKVKEEQTNACHGIGPKKNGEYESFVLSFSDRRAGSSWEEVTSAMMTGRNNFGKGELCYNRDANVFLSFQLTKPRAALAKAVREARYAGKVAKDSINQNGEIKVKLTGEQVWRKVSSEEELAAMEARVPLHRQQR